MNARLATAVVTIVAILSGAAVLAQQPSARLSPAALKEIAEVEVTQPSVAIDGSRRQKYYSMS